VSGRNYTHANYEHHGHHRSGQRQVHEPVGAPDGPCRWDHTEREGDRSGHHGSADATDDPTTIPVGPPHLRQAFYRKPQYSWINNAPIGPSYGGEGCR